MKVINYDLSRINMTYFNSEVMYIVLIRTLQNKDNL